MHLQIRAEHPLNIPSTSLEIEPNRLLVTSSGDTSSSSQEQRQSQGQQLMPQSSVDSSAIFPFHGLPQIQETILFSPDNTTAIPPSRDPHDSALVSPPSDPPPSPPPTASPGTNSPQISPATETLDQSPNIVSHTEYLPRPSSPPVTTTVASVSVSVSDYVVISKSISVSSVFISEKNEISTTRTPSELVPTNTTANIPMTTTGLLGPSIAVVTLFPISSGVSASEIGSKASNHRVAVDAGIIMGSIFGAIFICAFVAWILRTRWKRRQAYKKMRWSWDPENAGKVSMAPSVADGASIRDLDNPDQLQKFSESRERDAGEPRRSTSFIPLAEHRFGDNNLNTGHLFPEYMRTPTINRPQAVYSTGSTPDLANTLGPLTVANIMPGDVSMSGYEISHYGHSELGSEYGTPNEKMAGTVPRFMGLGTGLSVPWVSNWKLPETTIRRSSSSRYPRASTSNIELHNGQVQEASPPEAQHSWASSWKSNLASAFHAVVGSNGAANTSKSDRREDLLTPVPARSMRNSLCSMDSRRMAEQHGNLSRSSTSSTTRGYSLEETATGQGVVHVHNLGQQHLRPPMSRSGGSRASRAVTSSSRYTIPEEPELEAYEGEMTSKQFRTNSVCSIGSLPRLPSIQPTRALTLRRMLPQDGETVDGRPQKSKLSMKLGTSDNWGRVFASMMIEEDERKRAAANGDGMLSRTSSYSAVTLSSRTNSLNSSGLPLSRQSSASTLDRGELVAKRLLRMRRRRGRVSIVKRRGDITRRVSRRKSVRTIGSKSGRGLSHVGHEF